MLNVYNEMLRDVMAYHLRGVVAEIVRDVAVASLAGEVLEKVVREMNKGNMEDLIGQLEEESERYFERTVTELMENQNCN